MLVLLHPDVPPWVDYMILPFRKKSDEQRLLEKVKQGDANACEQMYHRYVCYLSAICSRYLIHDDDIRDVLQESFLKVFSSIHTFSYRGEGSLKAWMARIVLNETLNFIKHNKRLDVVEIQPAHAAIVDDEVQTADVPTEVLYEFIRELPQGYRTVFNLYVIENKSHKEIAELLGISIGTSASQLYKAKALLADRIKQFLKQNHD